MRFGVAVGTYGPDSWRSLAQRAVESAWAAGADEVVHVHTNSLALSRNTAGDQLSTDYLCFLDADDFLEPRFFDNVKKKIRSGKFIYKPYTRGIYTDGTQDSDPSLVPTRDMSLANHLIIGCPVRKLDFLSIGGFDGSLPALEDWDFFGRLILAGCKVIEVPGAVYRISVNPQGRNSIVENHARAFKTVKINFAKNEDRALLRDHMFKEEE